MAKAVTFDAANPDKQFVRMVLHQAFCDGGGLKEIFAEAWCLRDMDLANWKVLRKHLLDNRLIEESGENEYFRMTDVGNEVLGGRDYPYDDDDVSDGLT